MPTAIWVTNPQNKPPRTSNDPPDRKGFPKNILWIGLLCLVVLLLALPFLVMAVEGLAFKESSTQLQALAAAPASNQFGQGNNPANVDEMNKQMERSVRSFTGLFRFILVFQILIIILGATSFAFWLWMLISVVTTEPEGNDKIVWTILVVFTGPIGSLIYFFTRYGKKGVS